MIDKNNNKKDLCPMCKTNIKGVKAKTCKSCRLKSLAEARSNKGSKPFPNEPQTITRVGDTTPDGKFYL